MNVAALVAPACYWVVYLAGWSVLRRADGPLPRPTPWAVGLWCAVAVPSLLQFALPALLDLGRRDPAAIADGQWWRLLTSMFLQDGGWFGTVFNLLTLGVSVVLVSPVLRGAVMPAVFVLGGLVSNLLTLLVHGIPGAGNSMATMFLVVATAVVVALRNSPVPARPLLVLATVAVVLLVLGDHHGLAVAAGFGAGLATAWAGRTRRA